MSNKGSSNLRAEFKLRGPSQSRSLQQAIWRSSMSVNMSEGMSRFTNALYITATYSSVTTSSVQPFPPRPSPYHAAHSHSLHSERLSSLNMIVQGMKSIKPHFSQTKSTFSFYRAPSLP